MEDTDGRSVIPFDDAEKFYEYLSPNNEIWRDASRSGWIFRGQRNADWPLLPSAWRKEGRKVLQPLRDRFADRALSAVNRLRGNLPLPDLAAPPDEGTPRFENLIGLVADTMAEIEAVKQYARIADELGLHIEDLEELDLIDHIYKCPWDLFLTEGPASYPNYAQALAQHHDIPTRLLDWTMSARKAAFFAANDAIKHLNKGCSNENRLAVFALDQGFLGLRQPGVRKFSVPREQFRFVFAQDGLFLSLRGLGRNLWGGSENSHWPDVDQLLKIQTPSGDQHPIIRVTLPVTEADDLLKLLYHDRITEAHLKPTYENIKHLVFQEWKWNYRLGAEQR